MLGYRPSYDEVIKNTGTPAYVFDTDVLKSRLAWIKDILGEEIGICYAMKANPFFVGEIGDHVDRFEVCSPGEFKICERANVPMDKVVLSGVYKETLDTERIVTQYKDSILYTAESLAQFHLVNQSAIKANVRVDVILRITTGNQFGMDEKDIRSIIEKREDYIGVDIVGIQHFTGTQRNNLNIYREELKYCDELIEKLKVEYGFEAKELEFGTGFYFEYFQPKVKNGQEAIPEDVSWKREQEAQENLLKDFKSIINDMNFKGKITLEIGRFIAASCGTYYTSIVDKKHNCDMTFCIVDGGIHQMNYFGQMMAMKLPWYRQLKADGEIYSTGADKANICGALCTINDNLVKGMPLTDPQLGDILEFRNTGAYSMTETPALFLSRDLPKVYLYNQATGFKMMRDKIETNELNFPV